MKSSKIKKTSVTSALVESMSIVDAMVARISKLENKIEEHTKYLNVLTNTLNYSMSMNYAYESYFIELGFDDAEIRAEIDQLYYDAFEKNKKDGRESEFSKSVIKKINSKLKEFQSKLNLK